MLVDVVLSRAPPWLGGGDPVFTNEDWAKYLTALIEVQDALVEKMDQASKAHMPTLAPPSALPILGNDRVMTQGPSEPNASFALRLRGAFDAWSRAGNDLSVMIQVLAYLSPMTPMVRTVTDSSVWHTYVAGTDTTQPPAVQALSNWNWDNEGDPHPVGKNAWWRWWLVLFAVSPSAFAAAGPNWGDAGIKWGDTNRSWGFNVPASTFTTIRNIVKLWMRAGSWCRWMIVSFDSTLFDPTLTADDVHNPAGDFYRWSKITANFNGPTSAYVAARFANARYADGIY
jgi:hypothetical protein